MYTHPTFESFGTFILLRPVLYSFLIASIVLFVIIVWPKLRRKLANGFAVISISLIALWVSIQTVYFHAIIVDEIGLGGDPVSIYLLLVIAAFAVVNPILYFLVLLKAKTS